MLSQHASLLPADSLLLQQHPQIPVSISTSQGVANLAIPADQLHIENNQQNHSQMTTANSQSQTDNQNLSNQNQQLQNAQTNMVQVQVCDVIYPQSPPILRLLDFSGAGQFGIGN